MRFVNGGSTKSIILAVQNIEQCRGETEDVGSVLVHLGLVYEPPGVHDDLVLDGVDACLVVSVVDFLVVHGHKIRGCEDQVDSVPYGFACLA